jgi:replicative DNA helicase
MNDYSSFADGTEVPRGEGAVQVADPTQNIEAEQQLLGAILTRNEVYDGIASIIQARHFALPLHRRIYEAAEARIQKNALASPVTLKSYFEDDPDMPEGGAARYLALLAGSAVAAYAVKDFAQLVHDLWVRRELMALGQDITAQAAAADARTDTGGLITEAEQRLYAMAETGTVSSGFVSFLRATTLAVESAEAANLRKGKLAGISTGLVDLDKKLGGLHKSDLLILAGRPSMGKTSLATNIAFNIAKAYQKGKLPDGSTGAVSGGVVGFFSLEMSAEQLAMRVLSEAAEVPSELIRRGEMSTDEFRRFVEAARVIESCPLHIDDTPALPISQLAARARRLKREHGLDVLMIDYLQLVRPATAKDSRVNEVSEITQGLKAIAKELNIPVIALSQLSRQVENREDKRPQLSDLRESGSIEQDADVVMFVFREEYYREREKPADHDLEAMAKWTEMMEACHGKAEVIIGKQRHGPIGTVELSFEGQFTRFGNLAKQWTSPDREF